MPGKSDLLQVSHKDMHDFMGSLRPAKSSTDTPVSLKSGVRASLKFLCRILSMLTTQT